MFERLKIFGCMGAMSALELAERAGSIPEQWTDSCGDGPSRHELVWGMPERTVPKAPGVPAAA